MINGVENGRDVEKTEIGDLMMMTYSRDQFMVQKDKQCFCGVAKPDWWGVEE